MQRYVKRGFEDEICNVLNKYGIVCLTGLPGVGKTTTARYIAVKMQKERVVRGIGKMSHGIFMPKPGIAKF